MMMICGVALWLFPRLDKGDRRYRPGLAEAAYWMLTLGTGARMFFLHDVVARPTSRESNARSQRRTFLISSGAEPCLCSLVLARVDIVLGLLSILAMVRLTRSANGSPVH